MSWFNTNPNTNPNKPNTKPPTISSGTSNLSYPPQNYFAPQQHNQPLQQSFLNSSGLNPSLYRSFNFQVQNNFITVKVFHKKEIRRLRVPVGTDFGEFYKMALNAAKIKKGKLYYLDDEDEWISFDTEEEWQECLSLRILKERQYVKIKVAGGGGQGKKDNNEKKKPPVKEEPKKNENNNNNNTQPIIQPSPQPYIPPFVPHQPPIFIQPQPQPFPNPNNPPLVLFGNNNNNNNNIKPLIKEEPKENPFVHNGICCDQCGAQPVTGERYVCVTKNDYDLCGSCFNKRETFGMENHTFDLFTSDKFPVKRIGPVKKDDFPSINPDLSNSFTQFVNPNEPVKPVEPIVKPVEPAPPKDDNKYESKLKLLEEMGFTNREKNLELLKKHNGNMQSVVRAHLSGQ